METGVAILPIIMNDKLDDSTFLLFAMHNYDNPQCLNVGEFEEDLKRFGYLKKLFVRYKDNGDLKERLIINHLTILYNLFGLITTDLLFFKIDKQYWSILATFLVYLERMPETIPEFGINLRDIPLDTNLVDVLRKL